jgi:hypothetical protein
MDRVSSIEKFIGNNLDYWKNKLKKVRVTRTSANELIVI